MNILLNFLYVVFVLQTTVASHISNRISISSASPFHQISSDVFTCDSYDKTVRAACDVGLSKVNQELTDAGIAIDSNGVLFTYDDPTDKKINTGRSCTKRAQFRHKHVTARFSRGARLDFVLTSITEPVLLRVKLPAQVHARVDVRQRNGLKTPFGCTQLFRDSFSIKGDATTNANVVVGFNLDPKVGTTPAGDHVLVIKPKFVSVFALDDFKLKLHVSGKSRFATVFDFATGLISTLTKTATALIEGENVWEVVEKSLIFDVGVPFVLGIGMLPGPLEKLVWKRLVDRFVVPEAHKEVKKYSNDLEMKINSKLKDKLGLDSNGEKRFIIKKDATSLLGNGSSKDDIFFVAPENPVHKCRQNFARRQWCRQGRHGGYECDHVGIKKAMQYCSDLEAKWKKEYGAEKLRKPTPKVAQFV